jgi:hypothetical protein
MKRRTILLFAILGLVVYSALRYVPTPLASLRGGFDEYSDQYAIDLHVPDSVVTYDSPYHEPLTATGVSLVRPAGYGRMISQIGFSKDKDSCIDVIEDHSAGLSEKKDAYNKYLAYTKNDHGGDMRISYHKDFKFNGYDAFMICVSDTTSARTAIYMVFGDDRFNVTMSGTMADNTEDNRQEIVQTMLSAYYRKA